MIYAALHLGMNSVTQEKKSFLFRGKADATQCSPTGNISISNTQQLGVMGVMQYIFYSDLQSKHVLKKKSIN